MTQNVDWYTSLSGEILQGFGTRTRDVIQKFIDEIEGLEGSDLGFIQVAYAFAPDPITPEGYIERGPYGNPAAYQEQMDASVARGWLEMAGDGKYILSKNGKKVVKKFLSMGDEWFGGLPASSSEDSTRIADLLAKLVEKANKLEVPTDKPTFQIGFNLNPGADAAPMLRVRRHLVDIQYYREDVHIAAWKPYQVSGKVWETLTSVWREEASTPAEMVERYSEIRNYTEDDYIAAFDKLTALEWVAKVDGKYCTTEKGKEVRQGVEDKTEEYFSLPFLVLNQQESEELRDLLGKLAVVIKPEEEGEGA
jgi:hypothetical protein